MNNQTKWKELIPILNYIRDLNINNLFNIDY